MLGHIKPSALEAVVQDFVRCEKPDGTVYGTAGHCRKGTYVPLNDVNNPLPSGSTPLEKAQEKLKQYEKPLLSVDSTPTNEEYEKYGLQKLALESLRNLRKEKLELKKTKNAGRRLREFLPTMEDRKTLSSALFFIDSQYKVNKDDLGKLKERSKKVKETLRDLRVIIQRMYRIGPEYRISDLIFKTLKRLQDVDTRLNYLLEY